MKPAITISEATFGPINRALRIDDTWRYVGAMCKDHGDNPDQHPNRAMGLLGVNFVLNGTGRYIDTNGQSYELKPGTLFHRYPNRIHSTWFDPASAYSEFFVMIDASTAEYLMKLGLVSATPVLQVGLTPAVLEDFQQIYAQMKTTETELPSPAMLAHVIAFLNSMYDRARLARRLGYWEKMVVNARQTLERNLIERMSMEEIADQLGVSYTAFRKEFKKQVGVSPGDYRIRCRLESAQKLLMDHSVKEVATELGYCDPFTFSNQFKIYVGMSPRQYQQHVRQPVELK